MSADEMAEIIRTLAEDIEDGDAPLFVVTIVEGDVANTFTNIEPEEQTTIH